MVAKALECGYRRHRNCGRFLERQVRRLQRHDVDWHRNVFCKAAVSVVQEIGIDLVAGLELGNAAADRLDLPGNVDAEDLMFRPQQAQGGAREKGLAAHGMPVRRIDGYCQHLHQDFIGVRRRPLDLRHPKRLRRPVLLPYERLHDRLSPSRYVPPRGLHSKLTLPPPATALRRSGTQREAQRSDRL